MVYKKQTIENKMIVTYNQLKRIFTGVEDYSMTKKLIVLSLISLFVLFSACSGPKERQAESVLDTPEYHYDQGKKYLEKDDKEDSSACP